MLSGSISPIKPLSPREPYELGSPYKLNSIPANRNDVL